MKNYKIGKNMSIHMPENFGGANYMVLGAPGSGKTRYVLEPLLLQMNDTSHIIVDIKGSLFWRLAPRLVEHDYNIQHFDFIQFMGDRYNPIEFVQSEEDALTLATVIAGKPGPNEDPFWINASINILTALIGYCADFRRYRSQYINYELMQYGESKRYHNYRCVKSHSCLNLGHLSALVSEMMQGETSFSENGTSTRYGEDLLRRFACVTPKGENWWAFKRLRPYANENGKTLSCIVMTIIGCLNSYVTGNVQKMMATNDFCPEILGCEKTAVFISLKDYDPSLHQVAALMITQAVQHLIQQAGTKELKVPVQIWMDDCGSYVIPNLTQYLSCCRSRNIGFTLLCQSEHQLQEYYGPWSAETIVQCANTYIYLGGEDAKSAERIALRGNIMRSQVLSLDRRFMYVIQQGEAVKKVLKLDEEAKDKLEAQCEIPYQDVVDNSSSDKSAYQYAS